MAKARPSTSDDGCSNSAKMKPPSSIRTPSIVGASSFDLVADLVGAGEVDVVGQLDVGEGDLAGFRSLRRDLRRRRPARTGSTTRTTSGIAATSAKQRLHLLLDLGVVDALVGAEHDRADLTGALAAELCVEDVEAATSTRRRAG